MLSNKYIAKRYATALFSAAVEDKTTQLILDELLALKEVMFQELHNRKLLSNIAIPTKIKKELLQTLLAGAKVNRVIVNFLHLLVRHNRMCCLDEICEQYTELLYEYRGELHLLIESAEPLGEAACKKIASALSKSSGKKIITNNRANPKLLGGLVFKLDSKMLDCSLRNKLQKIEGALLSTPVKI